MRAAPFILLVLAGLPSATPAAENRYHPHPAVRSLDGGIAWPEGQALPIFATPAADMDQIDVHVLSPDEMLAFSALQGLVNRRKPRIHLRDARSSEGPDTWANTLGLEFGRTYKREDKLDLIAKYATEIAGAVLYDPAKSPHFRNLAGTVAGPRKALPLTPRLHGQLRERGVELKVLEDLTTLDLDSTVAIYQHLLDRYWKDCTRRLIVSARPTDRGDLHHTRDIAAAVGAAVIWLDCRIPEEKEMMRKFYGDMKAGNAIALGWYATERSGITTASEFGIGTLPADFYVSPSVMASGDHEIRIPPVPKMPALENKVYIALFISDGDNIQYNQHAMRQVWDRTRDLRGKIAFNWTIAPGLVDIGPGLMNYYYGSATPQDCFVSGPSGMGYAMPYNTLIEPGAPIGPCTTDPSRMDGYTRLTENYLQRSGLRVITIWDDATPMQRASYESNCRQLYGATVQNFKDVPAVEGGVTNGRLRFDKLKIPYAGSFEHINGSIRREIRRWDGKKPLFLSYQANIWSDLKPHRLVELKEQLDKEMAGRIEFVRADHYFNLHHEAEGLPYNLALDEATEVEPSDGPVHPAMDGTPVTLWSEEAPDKQWLGFDFGTVRQISRHVIRHAGDAGLDSRLNTRGFTVRASQDGKRWRTLSTVRDNAADVTDITFPATPARYVKLVINQPGSDATARIADVEIYGTR